MWHCKKYYKRTKRCREQTLKGTVSQDFWPFFGLKDYPRPHINSKNGFANFFIFAKIFDRKVRKSEFFWRYGSLQIFKLLLLYVLTHLNIFAKTKKFAKPFLPVHMGPRCCTETNDTVKIPMQYIEDLLTKD